MKYQQVTYIDGIHSSERVIDETEFLRLMFRIVERMQHSWEKGEFCKWKRATTEDYATDLSYSYRRKDGEGRVVETTFYPIHD